jgi:wobble nucleotide-excising tRNase
MIAQMKAVSIKVEDFKKEHCTARDKAKLIKLQEEKKGLEIIKKRFESPYKEICEVYKQLEEGFKKTLKPNEETCFKAKVDYAKSIFEEYEQSINGILENLGADFCLVDLKPSTKRRGAEKLFCLQFFDNVLAKVELDGAEHVANFKNTLSDSDKRMLAFAFFMAQLKNKEDLSDVIVVMDDPMSSFDLNRKTHTIKLLRDELKGKNGNLVEQLIILTHEDNFFKLTHEFFERDSKYLRIVYKNTDKTSEFVSCDVNEEFLKEGYFKEIDRLKMAVDANDDDITSGDLDLVRKCLEHVMKRKHCVILETEIKQNKSIGEFVKKLKDEGVYSEDMDRKIQDLLPHKSHHDQSNNNSVSELEPSEKRDIIKNFFNVLKEL